MTGVLVTVPRLNRDLCIPPGSQDVNHVGRRKVTRVTDTGTTSGRHRASHGESVVDGTRSGPNLCPHLNCTSGVPPGRDPVYLGSGSMYHISHDTVCVVFDETVQNKGERLGDTTDKRKVVKKQCEE